MAEDFGFSYNNQLYNTSNFAIKPTPLGTNHYPYCGYGGGTISATARDQELFGKLRDKAVD